MATSEREIRITLSVDSSAEANLQVSDDGDMTLALGEPYIGSSPPEYQGDYEVTPSGETQFLDTANKVLTQAVTINPIPSNYGLITWNGSVLTVS